MNANESGPSFSEHIGALRRTLRRALVRRLALETDRPLNQLLALRSIAVNEVETQADLSARLTIDPPAASRLVTRLERDGLLRRVEGRDRREVGLKLTRAAAKDLRAIRVGLAWLDGQMREVLGPAAFREMTRSMVRLQRGLGGR